MKLPRFTLRDLFWLVALVAMGCGWWVDHARQVADRDSAYMKGIQTGVMYDKGRVP